MRTRVVSSTSRARCVSEHLAQDARGFARAVVARQRVGVEAFDVQQHRVWAQRAEGRTGGRQCRLDGLQGLARAPEVRKGVRKRRAHSERSCRWRAPGVRVATSTASFSAAIAAASRPRLVCTKAWPLRAWTSNSVCRGCTARRSLTSAGNNGSDTDRSPNELAASTRWQRLCKVNGWVAPSVRVHRSTTLDSQSRPAR